jgi:hypothetical protein
LTSARLPRRETLTLIPGPGASSAQALLGGDRFGRDRVVGQRGLDLRDDVLRPLDVREPPLPLPELLWRGREAGLTPRRLDEVIWLCILGLILVLRIGNFDEPMNASSGWIIKSKRLSESAT